MTTLFAAGIPVGTIIAFGGPVAQIPSGFLLCDGSLLDRNLYADLFNIIGTNWGTDTPTDFRVPTLNGNFLRGQDLGAGADGDAATRIAIQAGGATGDNVGSFQDSQIQSHSHVVNVMGARQTLLSGINLAAQGVNGQVNNTGYYTNNGFNNLASVNRLLVITNARVDGGSIGAANGNTNLNDTSPNDEAEFLSKQIPVATTNAGGSQTNPRNAYVNYIIKF
jgi:microcystin-dependent protein